MKRMKRRRQKGNRRITIVLNRKPPILIVSILFPKRANPTPEEVRSLLSAAFPSPKEKRKNVTSPTLSLPPFSSRNPREQKRSWTLWPNRLIATLQKRLGVLSLSFLLGSPVWPNTRKMANGMTRGKRRGRGKSEASSTSRPKASNGQRFLCPASLYWPISSFGKQGSGPDRGPSPVN